MMVMCGMKRSLKILFLRGPTHKLCLFIALHIKQERNQWSCRSHHPSVIREQSIYESTIIITRETMNNVILAPFVINTIIMTSQLSIRAFRCSFFYIARICVQSTPYINYTRALCIGIKRAWCFTCAYGIALTYELSICALLISRVFVCIVN